MPDTTCQYALIMVSHARRCCPTPFPTLLLVRVETRGESGNDRKQHIESLYFLIIHLYTDMILIKKCNILLIKAKSLPFFTCIFATTISGRNVTIRFTGHDT